MELINNRYRILKYLAQNRIFTSYLVNDINTNHKAMQINIVNGEYTDQNLLSFLSENFIKLCNIYHPNIIKLFNFGVIRTLDNTTVNYPQYYYTCEFVDNNCSFTDFILKSSFEKCLDSFIEIAVALNHIHASGLIYDEIIPENILIHTFENDPENNIIKLRDFAGKEIIKHSHWADHSSDIFRKAPEIINGEPSSIKSDIYSLGILFYRMMFRDFKSHINISEKLHGIKSLKNADKLIPIISRMTNINASERYENINAVITAVNNAFGTSYRSFDKSYLEKLNFNVKIAGRVNELQFIMSKYNDLISFNNDRNLIFVHGESGVGKTRFLNEINHLLSIKMANVYNCFSLENTFTQSNEGLIELLRKIIAGADKELIYQYGPELVKFIPELSEEKNILPSEPLEGDREKFRLINRLAGFILSCIKNTPAVFIIDNFQQASDLFIDLVEYICVNGTDNNFLFIISYSDDEFNSGTCFEKFISRFHSDYNALDLKLNCLTSYETSLMIQNILNYCVAPVVFGRKIYSQTYGNPLFIQEVINNLFEQKILYIDDSTGLWSTDDKGNEYEKILVPLTIRQVLLQQIDDLDTVSKKILQVISLFNIPVLLDIITEFLNDNIDVISLINNLVAHNILIAKIQENGYAYDINNKTLKKLIYYQLDEKSRKKYHRKAFHILEKLFGQNLFDNHDELFYQLKLSEDKESIIVFNMQKAENACRLKLRFEEISALEQALSAFPKSSIDIRKLNILKRLASAYFFDGNIKDSLSTYEILKKIAAKLKQYKLEIDALNKIASIYVRLQQYKKCPPIIHKMEELLKCVDYPEGRLNYLLNLADSEYRKNRLDKSIKICKSGLKLCEEDQYLYMGKFSNMLGNIYLDKLDGKKSLNCFHKSLDFYKKANYLEGITSVLNNMGALYSDLYQDEDTSLKYFIEMNEFCDKNNTINNKSLALSNIGATYLEKLDYENALKYINESIVLSKKTYSDSTMFFSLTLMPKLYASIYDYSHAFSSYEELKSYYNSHTADTYCRSLYLIAKAGYYYMIGDIDSGLKYINEYFGSDDEYTKIDWNNKIFRLQMELYKNKQNTDIIRTIAKDILINVEKCENVLFMIDNLLESSIVLYNINQVDISRELYMKARKINFTEKNERLNLKFKYLESIHSKGSKKLHCLEEALTLADKLNSFEIKIKCLSAIGDFYYFKNSIYYAFNYYFEACSIIKTMINEIPEKYKVLFINFYRYDEPLKKLKAIKYKYENKMSEEDNLCSSLTNLDDLSNLLNFDNIDDIISSKKFIDSSRSIYYKDMDKSLKNKNNLLKNLSYDIVDSLQMLLKYMCYYTIASKGIIIVPDADQNLRCIASNTDNMELPHNNSILKEVRAKNAPSIYKGSALPDEYKKNTGVSYSCIKAVLCIPIVIEDDNLSLLFENDRRKKFTSSKHLMGYIYLETNRTINNFNAESADKCASFNKLIGILLEKYQLKMTSCFDKLTGTLTRKYLEDAILNIIEYAEKMHSEFSLIMMDLDYFKEINDRFGHQTGDTVLKKVCEIVLKNLRSTDICGRYGGEEFIIILPNTMSSGAYTVAEKLRKLIDDENILGNKGRVTVSMGIVSFPDQASLKQELLYKVDQALYAAKESGRNKCIIWQDEFSSKSKSTNTLAGIITGNAVSDYRNVLDIVEIIDLIHKDIAIEDKIFSFLGRIIEKTEAQYGFFFTVENHKIMGKFGRKKYEDKWIDSNNYNNKIVNSVLFGEQYIHKIDWDEIKDYDRVTGMPDWQSVISIPITYKNELKGILYLTVSTKQKEFTTDEFNFVSKLCELAATFL